MENCTCFDTTKYAVHKTVMLRMSKYVTICYIHDTIFAHLVLRHCDAGCNLIYTAALKMCSVVPF